MLQRVSCNTFVLWRRLMKERMRPLCLVWFQERKKEKKWHHMHTCISRALSISEQSVPYKIKQFISMKFVLLVNSTYCHVWYSSKLSYDTTGLCQEIVKQNLQIVCRHNYTSDLVEWMNEWWLSSISEYIIIMTQYYNFQNIFKKERNKQTRRPIPVL